MKKNSLKICNLQSNKTLFFVYTSVNNEKIAGMNKETLKVFDTKVGLFYTLIYNLHFIQNKLMGDFLNMVEVEEKILKRYRFQVEKNK